METFPNAEQLKSLPVKELDALSARLRTRIVETVAENGGHLASNLGAVELTVALHYVFDLSRDKIVFDVGHQCYTHKLLTGREASFGALRREGGASGFPQTDEHPSDAFTAGHASTAISAAVGMAYARELRKEDYAVIAVVGDGAMSGGLCYEALNDAGQHQLPLIVILNDNEMSIAKSVGAFSRHLTVLRQSRHYRTMKKEVRKGLSALPWMGKRILGRLSKLHAALRLLLVGESFFSSLGFTYLGPVDGHDLRRLVRIFNRAKSMDTPVVLHVVTQKGYGYSPAENAPEAYHGVAPFFVESGETRKKAAIDEMDCGAVACGMLARLARTNPKLCGITAAMPQGTGMTVFAAQHPNRFFDVGIAEEHAVVMAGAMASSGMHPFVAVYSTFLERAYDQMLVDICRNNLPVTFLLDRAGLVGADGATHQGVFDLSYLRTMPNLMLLSPRDPAELGRMVEFCSKYEGTAAIRYPKSMEVLGLPNAKPGVYRPDRWEPLSPGEDVEIFAVGRCVQAAMQASIYLAGKGISAGVTDARCVKPLDIRVLMTLSKNKSLIVTVEENTLCGGFGEAVTAALSSRGLRRPVLNLGVPDCFVAHGSVSRQLEQCGLDAQGIADAIVKRLNRGARK